MTTRLAGILAVIAGFVVATAVMMTVETVNGRFLYPELGRLAAGMTDREAIRTLLAGAPTGALVVVIVGWAVASVAGGGVAAWIAGRRRILSAMIVGGLLTVAGIANNLMLPPPSWFWIAGLVVFLPTAYAGARLAGARLTTGTDGRERHP